MTASRTGRERDFHRVSPLQNQQDRNRPRAVHHGVVDSQDTLGQFSFGPATQTTVVTTTTTTTTNFPPFLMRAPGRIQQLDPKIYPLATTPTPNALKTIHFVHQGRQTVFREASDTSIALEELRETHESLRRGNGTVQSIKQTHPSQSELTGQPTSPSKNTSEIPASPSSIDDNEHHSAEPKARRAKQARHRDGRPVEREHPFRSSSRPFDAESNEPGSSEPQTRISRPPHRQSHYSLGGVEMDAEDALMLSPHIEIQPMEMTDTEDEHQATAHRRSSSRTLVSRASHETIVPTPPVEPEDDPLQGQSLTNRALSSIPARLHLAESPATQDGNLPSPSLSPVTAAARGQGSGYFTDQDSESSFGAHSICATAQNYEDASSEIRYGSPAATEPDEPSSSEQQSGPTHNLSMNDFPAMFEYFETLPDQLKSYVMHQLLRRCPKSTLHVVADTVNPALKCDFLSILPPELGLQILSHLDVKSLCKAAQVSRKWRQIVNGDEKAWKELFDTDGFLLPDGELQRAITQGWGWQDPHGIDGHEQDLAGASSIKVESEAESSMNIESSLKIDYAMVRRSKRKAAGALNSNRNKQMKRQGLSRDVSEDAESIDWMAQMSTMEGPYNAANAAILAVPNPRLPLPSLKGLHLYKSLYRRHHLIRRNWMTDETKPRHIAFRAHDSHVVTCLQFDTDKILTGSDDNNINVYDTKTGALRQLLKGHEGGVWALQYEGNTLVSGSTDRSVRVWDVEQGMETHVFRGHTSTVRCLQIVMPTKVGETVDGKAIMMPRHPLIITGSRDSTLRVWRLPQSGDEPFIQAESDAESDDCPYFIRTLTGHQHSVRAIAAYADTLVSGSYDCTVRVWKISTGETVHRLQGHSQKVYSVVLDHTRNRCISGSMDNLVKIWSLSTGAPLYTLEGHTSLVGLLDLNSDRLVSAAADSTLRIWDPENGQCKATLTAHTGAITCFQHDGQKVISGSDRTLKMWDIKTGECLKDLLSDLSGVWQVKFNDRRCVAAVQRDQMTYIEVLDFGASRDGISEDQRGRRIVVDESGREVKNDADNLNAFDDEQRAP